MASSRGLKEHKQAYQRKYYAEYVFSDYSTFLLQYLTFPSNLETERQKARTRAEWFVKFNWLLSHSNSKLTWIV